MADVPGDTSLTIPEEAREIARLSAAAAFKSWTKLPRTPEMTRALMDRSVEHAVDAAAPLIVARWLAEYAETWGTADHIKVIPVSGTYVKEQLLRRAAELRGGDTR